MEGLERSGSAGMEPLQLRSPPPGALLLLLSWVRRSTMASHSRGSDACAGDYRIPSSRRCGPGVRLPCCSSRAGSSHPSGSAETLDKHVVHPTPLAIHTDLNVVFLERRDPVPACELASLVGVEYLWAAACAPHRVLESPHTEGALHRVAQLPGQHRSAVPVHDRHQVSMAFLHGDIGDVGAPDFVDSVIALPLKR